MLKVPNIFCQPMLGSTDNTIESNMIEFISCMVGRRCTTLFFFCLFILIVSFPLLIEWGRKSFVKVKYLVHCEANVQANSNIYIYKSINFVVFV